MAVTIEEMRGWIIFCGVVSYVLAAVAEINKPEYGVLITEKGVARCKYASGLTVVSAFLSCVFVFGTAVVGRMAVFYPYKGRAIPESALYQSIMFHVAYNLALILTGVAAMLLLWPIYQQHQLAGNVYPSFQAHCPTIMSGLIATGSIISVNSCLVWLVALLLANNAREDYFDEN